MKNKKLLIFFALILCSIQSVGSVRAANKTFIYSEDALLIPPPSEEIETTEETTEDSAIPDELLPGLIGSPDSSEESTESQAPDSSEETGTSEDPVITLPGIPDDEDSLPEDSLVKPDGTKEDAKSDEDKDGDNSVLTIALLALAGVAAVVVIILLINSALGRKKKNNNNNDEDDATDAIRLAKANYKGVGYNIHLELNCGTLKKNCLDFVLKPTLTIGQDDKADIVFVNSNVEPIHARLEIQNDSIYLIDMSTTSGTYISGMRIQEQNIVTNGDILSVGDTEFRIYIGDVV